MVSQGQAFLFCFGDKVLRYILGWPLTFSVTQEDLDIWLLLLLLPEC